MASVPDEIASVPEPLPPQWLEFEAIFAGLRSEVQSTVVSKKIPQRKAPKMRKQLQQLRAFCLKAKQETDQIAKRRNRVEAAQELGRNRLTQEAESPQDEMRNSCAPANCEAPRRRKVNARNSASAANPKFNSLFPWSANTNSNQIPSRGLQGVVARLTQQESETNAIGSGHLLQGVASGERRGTKRAESASDTSKGMKKSLHKFSVHGDADRGNSTASTSATPNNAGGTDDAKHRFSVLAPPSVRRIMPREDRSQGQDGAQVSFYEVVRKICVLLSSIF
ncbi:hypothetical protein CYMTET_23553 [Cymbomonas tetramitiformis]|uniref:Uncharacterized protein n=1 Tax=Cymbomonas tetramitiformis TaxID=36881 RepID=A0AAE0L0U6_9CHLO|nr:hypothetical protein CYMTET_23553 [Cymbomonas tetramitiformis]